MGTTRGGSTLPNRASETPQPPAGPAAPEPVAPPLETDEELVAVLRGIGSVMFLTTERIILARDGVERRPRTGIQSFPLGGIRQIRLERGNGPSGRVVVWAQPGQEAVSMFYEVGAVERARELVAAARIRMARQRAATSRPG
jgi:hypothetical protein